MSLTAILAILFAIGLLWLADQFRTAPLMDFPE